MAGRGWIKLHRRLQDNPYWQEKPFSRGQAWVDLILIANHAPGHIRKRGKLIEIQRGQIGHSQQTLADRWGWSRGKTIRFLNELETKQQIRQQKNNFTTVISLENYEEYQEKKTPEKTPEKTPNDTANEQQTVPEQEEKEYLRKKPGQKIDQKKATDLKKIISGSRDHTLVSKYAMQSGITGASFDDLKVWASRELTKIKRGGCHA